MCKAHVRPQRSVLFGMPVLFNGDYIFLFADLGGVFVDFEEAARDCAADSRAFDLVVKFIQILESQTLLMKKLIDKVAGSQQR